MRVRKAVIPAAGLGTRFLPVTKALPKEMLPIIDTPIIQLVVEEAVAAGIDDILIVTGRGKRAIEDHFDRHLELEHHLAGHHDHLLPQVRNLAHLADIHFVRQKEPLGLGHAILQARRHVGSEPFAVLLGDEFFKGSVPCLSELIQKHAATGGTVIGTMPVPAEQVNKYGIIDAEPIAGGLFKIHQMVEKPEPEQAPSNLAIVGRYVLMPEIFSILAKLPPGKNGEIQLTDGLALLAQRDPVYAWQIEAQRFDVGDRLGYLEATTRLALDRPDIGPAFRRFLADLLPMPVAHLGDD